MIPSRRLVLALALSAFSIAACSDNATEPDPDPDPTTGSISVAVTTTGSDPDADGYTVTVGSSSQSVGTSGAVTFDDLGAGATNVSLGGVAANCSPAEANPQTATVVLGQTANVSFNVRCVALLEEFTLVAADRSGNIHSVEPTSGVETLLFTPLAANGMGGTDTLGVISSMAWVASTDSWWLGLGGNSVCGNDGCIYVRDTTTSEEEWIEFTRTELYATPGLAPHPDGNRVFTFEADGDDPLVVIDAAGVVDTVLTGLNEGSAGKGTTFSPDTLLYVWGSDRLTEIDVDAGTWSVVTDTMILTGFPPLVDSSPTIGSMTTRPGDGVVFGVLKDGGGGGSTTTTYLVTVDLSTGEITHVGANTNLLDGLAFIPSRLLVR